MLDVICFNKLEEVTLAICSSIFLIFIEQSDRVKCNVFKGKKNNLVERTFVNLNRSHVTLQL